MRKILLLIVSAVIVGALAGPAMASAASLSNESGEPLEIGMTVSGASTNYVERTALGDIECEYVEFHATVVSNEEGQVELDGSEEGEGAMEGCTFRGEPEERVLNFESIHLGASGNSVEFSFEFLPAESFIAEKAGGEVSYVPGASSVHLEGSVSGGIPATFSADVALSDKEGAVIVK